MYTIIFIGGNPEHFKALCYVHSILSNEESRSLYDETGEIDSDSDSSLNEKDFDEWYDYFRNLFPKLTDDSITQFSTQYKDSEEERNDIFNAYSMHDGHIKHVFDTVMLLEVGEEVRLCIILDIGIKNGNIETTSSYSKFRQQYERAIINATNNPNNIEISSNSKCASNSPPPNEKKGTTTSSSSGTGREKPSKTVKKTKATVKPKPKPTGKNDMQSLEALILGRSNSNNADRQEDMYDNLLKKYGSKKDKDKNKNKNSKKQSSYDDIDDEAFDKARSRVMK